MNQSERRFLENSQRKCVPVVFQQVYYSPKKNYRVYLSGICHTFLTVGVVLSQLYLLISFLGY